MKALKVMAVLLTALMTLSVPVAAGTVNTADNTNITKATELTLDEKKYGLFQMGNEYWYSYLAESDGNYIIGVLDKNPNGGRSEGNYLKYTIFDETGEILLEQNVASRFGMLTSSSLNLDANKTIYIKISGVRSQFNLDDGEYLITVQKVEEGVQKNLLQTDTSNISESISGKASLTMEDALVIPVNEEMYGELDEKNEWLAFDTNGIEGAEYTISAVRTESGSAYITIILCDGFGNVLVEEALDKNGFYTNITQSLEADSIYYVCVRNYDHKTNYAPEYILNIKTEDSAATSPSKPASEAPETGEEPTQEDELFD